MSDYAGRLAVERNEYAARAREQAVRAERAEARVAQLEKERAFWNEDDARGEAKLLARVAFLEEIIQDAILAFGDGKEDMRDCLREACLPTSDSVSTDKGASNVEEAAKRDVQVVRDDGDVREDDRAAIPSSPSVQGMQGGSSDSRATEARSGAVVGRSTLPDPGRRLDPRPSDPLRELAQKVVEACKAREGEDIDAWAEKLAGDSVTMGEAEYGRNYSLCTSCGSELLENLVCPFVPCKDPLGDWRLARQRATEARPKPRCPETGGHSCPYGEADHPQRSDYPSHAAIGAGGGDEQSLAERAYVAHEEWLRQAFPDERPSPAEPWRDLDEREREVWRGTVMLVYQENAAAQLRPETPVPLGDGWFHRGWTAGLEAAIRECEDESDVDHPRDPESPTADQAWECARRIRNIPIVVAALTGSTDKGDT